MAPLSSDTKVGVVGAGAMGSGIAQIAAAAGHPVVLYDTRSGAAVDAKAKIAQGLSRLVEKGKIDASNRDALLRRIQAVEELCDFKGAGVVIEAIIEDLQVKKDLFQSLESLLPNEAIMATNTSSLSIEDIATSLRNPARFG